MWADEISRLGLDRCRFLISGGASGLVEHLAPGVNLEELQRFNAWALGSGLDITAINWLRQRLSLIKGGGLARVLGRRRALALMISDVPLDDPRMIGSGLLHVNRSRSASREAADAAGRPGDVTSLLAKARRPTLRRETPRVPVRIVASSGDACRAAARRGRALGFAVRLHRARFSGDTAALARRFSVTLLRSPAGSLHVWGGESTVRLPSRPGRGGRNQQLALHAAVELTGHDDVALLAAGTDGIDGVTDDAGAVVDGGTVRRGVELGLDAQASLTRTDAATFLEECGALVHTGPTLTNVGDLVLAIRSEKAR
jgi:hydroxypyruvate reductase